MKKILIALAFFCRAEKTITAMERTSCIAIIDVKGLHSLFTDPINSFILAASDGDLEKLQKIASVDFIKRGGQEATMLAAFFGKINTLCWLLDNGVESNPTLLEEAIVGHDSEMDHHNLPVIKELIKRGVGITPRAKLLTQLAGKGTIQDYFAELDKVSNTLN